MKYIQKLDILLIFYYSLNKPQSNCFFQYLYIFYPLRLFFYHLDQIKHQLIFCLKRKTNNQSNNIEMGTQCSSSLMDANRRAEITHTASQQSQFKDQITQRQSQITSSGPKKILTHTSKKESQITHIIPNKIQPQVSKPPNLSIPNNQKPSLLIPKKTMLQTPSIPKETILQTSLVLQNQKSQQFFQKSQFSEFSQINSLFSVKWAYDNRQLIYQKFKTKIEHFNDYVNKIKENMQIENSEFNKKLKMVKKFNLPGIPTKYQYMMKKIIDEYKQYPKKYTHYKTLRGGGREVNQASAIIERGIRTLREHPLIDRQQKTQVCLRALGDAGAVFSDLQVPIYRGFHPDANRWRLIGDGFNLQGICKTQNCEAFQQKVWIPLGYKKFTHMNQLLCTAPCPICKKPARRVQNMAIFNARVKIKGAIGYLLENKEYSDPQPWERTYIHGDKPEDKDRILTFRTDDTGRFESKWYYLNIFCTPYKEKTPKISNPFKEPKKKKKDIQK